MNLFKKEKVADQQSAKLPVGTGHINYTWLVKHFGREETFSNSIKPTSSVKTSDEQSVIHQKEEKNIFPHRLTR